MKPARFVVDLGCVIVFVAIGRSTHDHGLAPSGVLSTLWPFALGLVGGWYLTIRRGHSGASLADALLIVVVTVALGMIVRVLVGQGTAFAFVLVALAFLSFTFAGWRLALRVLRRGRH